MCKYNYETFRLTNHHTNEPPDQLTFGTVHIRLSSSVTEHIQIVKN
jgi:hypothetical protein